jgi:hypothetical protein
LPSHAHTTEESWARDETTHAPAQVAANPIVAVGYNYNHEKERKRCLAYLLSRTPGQSTEEAAILEEAAAAEERRRARAATMPVCPYTRVKL